MFGSQAAIEVALRVSIRYHLRNVIIDRMKLESALNAKEVAMTTARQIYADNNVIIQQSTAETDALRRQLAQVQATQSSSDGTVGNAVAQTSELFQLERELSIQRALYTSYLRFLEGTAVEYLTSTANVRILEPAFVDSERQIWWPAASAALAFLLLWGAIESYRLRPPVRARIEPEFA